MSFTPLAEKTDDVIVIPYFKGRWLFTRHPKRGLEFPGGKREEKENSEEAAQREVMEETGARISNLLFIADYCVYQPKRHFIKRAFFGEVAEIILQSDYFETEGPTLLKGHLPTLIQSKKYSYFMRDEGMKKIIATCEKNAAVSAMMKKNGG